MRYWRIMPDSPYPPERFDQVWSYDLANNTIAIGWSDVGDFSNLVDDHALLLKAFRRTYPDASSRTATAICNVIRRFYGRLEDGMQAGDRVMACRGRAEIVGVGTVTGPAYYDEAAGRTRVAGMNGRYSNSNFRPVRWEVRTPLRLPPLTLPRSTMSQMAGDQFEEVLGLGKKE
jgi:hypothetical protein